jgi:hypothetical protein
MELAVSFQTIAFCSASNREHLFERHGRHVPDGMRETPALTMTLSMNPTTNLQSRARQPKKRSGVIGIPPRRRRYGTVSEGGSCGTASEFDRSSEFLPLGMAPHLRSAGNRPVLQYRTRLV